jgi:hypothetical protein
LICDLIRSLNRRLIGLLPSSKVPHKKLPSGSGESTGQRAPAWGNRIFRPGSEDGGTGRESPFAKIRCG